MVYVLLFFVATVAFALQIREYISLKTHTEDALAASNLASAVIDIQEYGINHNLVIKDPEPVSYTHLTLPTILLV